jgi:hypothetical protein
MATGSIIAEPIQIHLSRKTMLGRTKLTWRPESTTVVKLKTGAPHSLLFYESGPKGSTFTGNWVRNEMKFYLQDVSGGKPLCRANTLDAVQVRVITEPEN